LIHHGEVMVVDDNDDDQEDDAEAQYLSQFSDAFEAHMQHESANEQAHGYDAGGIDNNDGDVGGVNNNDGGAREGMQKTLTT
jgi:hypothetical protein